MTIEKKITALVAGLTFLFAYTTYATHASIDNSITQATYHTFTPEAQKGYCQAVKEASEVDFEAFICSPQLNEDFKKTEWGKAAILKFPGLASVDCKALAEIVGFETLKRASDKFLEECLNSSTSTVWKMIDFKEKTK